jgi:AcrR family transcriptional regulator
MYPKSKGGAFRPLPLPRGRHTLSREVVRASQRERVVHAMLALVAERGYAVTTVAAVTTAARVGRNTFYKFFPDKESCFLAACAEAAGDIIATMETFGIEADWIVGVRRGMRTWLQWWQDRPGFARAYLMELPLVGEAAVRQREFARERFEQLFVRLGERIRREQPDLPALPTFVPRVLMYALIEMVAVEVRAGRTDRLTEIEDAAMFITVKLLADDATAATVLRPPLDPTPDPG